MTDWREIALADLTHEGYSEPETMVAKIEGRAEAAKWVAIPRQRGTYLNFEGIVFEINDGAMSGERAELFYIKSGPYIKVPDTLVQRGARDNAIKEASDLRIKLDSIREIVGEDDDE